jgi:hypothetical protein
LIVLVCGLPGVGKTTLSKEIAPLIDAIHLSTDKIRKQLIQKPTYHKQERELIYDVFILIAKYLHIAGKNCILDATFNKEKSRKDVQRKLALPSDQVFIVECVCPEDLVISRIESRKNDWSDADINIYHKMKEIYEPVRGKHITADTSKPAKMIARVVSKIIQKK